MKAFVTGGTGFIGRQIVIKLLKRGYDVYSLSHSGDGTDELEKLGAHIVIGDINDPISMREAMSGSDVVFHTAGWYKIGAPDWMSAETINVAGTRTVLRLAHELGIPKIIYSSSVVVYGNTKGVLADESFYQEGPFNSEYDRTKWLAHYKVALPLIQEGAPIIIVVPGSAYGPRDHSWVMQLMRRFYTGRLLFVPGSDYIQTYAHVEDIAEGHILAAEKGRTGECYNLAGPAIPLGEIVDFWTQLTGRSGPTLHIPARFLLPYSRLAEGLGGLLPLPDLFSIEAIRSLNATYMAKSDKAKKELGWRTRTLQDGMSETFEWIAQQEISGGKAPRSLTAIPLRERQIAGFALLAAALLLVVFLLGRRRQT